MSEVNKWYSGKSVLITGCTGFLGRCLVEKLLRDCHEIENIYLLIRGKNKASFKERKTIYLEHCLFENSIKLNPKLIKKIQFIEGDITDLNLSIENLQNIYENISIIFHCAADVHFDRTLDDAYTINVIGTKNMLNLAKNVKFLESFIYVSTLYSQTNDKVIEEKSYSTGIPLNILNKIITKTDKELLKILTPFILDKYPNTYAFTKGICEQIVCEYRKHFPIVIARPSIVVSIWKDPLPGYTEGIHGINGWSLAVGRGVLRSMLCHLDQPCHLIPADIVANALIISAFKSGTEMKMTNSALFINIAPDPITWRKYMYTGYTFLKQNPFNFSLWVPGGTIHTNRILHYINVIILQLLPALFIDGFLKIFRIPTIMLKIQRKIYLGLKGLEFYTNNEFYFRKNNFDKMMTNLNKIDRKIYYNLDKNYLDEFIRKAAIGTKIYLLKEKMKNLPKAQRFLSILTVLDVLFKGLIFYWIILTIFQKIDLQFF